MKSSIIGHESPKHKEKTKRSLDSSQIKVNSRYVECEESNIEVSNLVNQSMAIFQEPQFIDSEIDDFESRLALQNKMNGFCKIEREKSLLLSNTEGYRKYKNGTEKKEVSKRYEDMKDSIKEESKKNAEKMNKCFNKKETGKIENKEESESLAYSTESQERNRENVLKEKEQSLSPESKQNL